MIDGLIDGVCTFTNHGRSQQTQDTGFNRRLPFDCTSVSIIRVKTVLIAIELHSLTNDCVHFSVQSTLVLNALGGGSVVLVVGLLAPEHGQQF